MKKKTEQNAAGAPQTGKTAGAGAAGFLKKNWKWLVPVACVAVLGGVWLLKPKADKPASVDTSYVETAPEQRDLVNALSGTGTLKPANTYNVKSLVSGKVLTCSFEEGDNVEEGDVLYTVDSSDATTKVEQAGITLQQAQRNYDKTVDRNQYGYFKNFSRTHTRNGCTYTQDFGTEDFYVYMMAHAAKHFYQTGCGIRHLIDIYVYLERFGEQMDRNYLDKELEQCGILTFTGHMEKLAYLWLEEEESNALYDNLFAYLLDSGIYGKDENGIWNKFAEEKKKGKTAGRQQLKFWYAFPPLHYMAEYYPYLEDCPWLLPWAWLVRGITGLAKHKGTYKRQMMNHIDEERIRTVQDIYEKMDLKFQS